MQNTIDFGGIGWLVSALAALTLVCIWCWRRNWTKRAEGPACGQCGYDVRGLPSSICPECGSDLKLVGTVEPGSATRMGAGMRVLCWTLTMVMLSPAVVWLGVRYGPGYRYEQASYELVPKSGACSRVAVQYCGAGVGMSVPVGTVKCLLDPPNRITVILEVYQGGKTCSYPDQKWQQVRAGFDESAVVATMRTGALDTSSAQVKAEAAELYQMLRGIADGSRRRVAPANFTWYLGSPGFRRVETPEWLKYGYLVACAMVWYAGRWWIARRGTAIAAGEVTA